MIELLIVMVMLAILVSLLLPVMKNARARAGRLTCVTHLRQINLGVRMYSDDSHDTSPTPGQSEVTANPMDPLYLGYKALMKNYVGLKGDSSPNDKVFACPADNLNINYLFTNPPPSLPPRVIKKSLHDSSEFDYSSYTFNGGDNITRHFEDKSLTLPGLTGASLSSVKRPERTILCAEISALYPYSWHDPSSHGAAHYNATMYDDSKNVVSFVDGHVSYLRMHYEYPVAACLTNPPPDHDYQWTPD